MFENHAYLKVYHIQPSQSFTC